MVPYRWSVSEAGEHVSVCSTGGLVMNTRLLFSTSWALPFHFQSLEGCQPQQRGSRIGSWKPQAVLLSDT